MAVYLRYSLVARLRTSINKLSETTSRYSTSPYEIEASQILGLSEKSNLHSRPKSFRDVKSSPMLNLHASPLFATKGVLNDFKKETSLKRLQRRKVPVVEGQENHQDNAQGWQVTAYATAEEFNLEKLGKKLVEKNVYKLTRSSNDILTSGGADIIYAIANYQLSPEPRQIYFFREGSVVFWNTPELECLSILDFLIPFQIGSYNRDLVLAEKEIMTYSYDTSNKRSNLVSNTFIINSGPDRSDIDIHLDRFTLSNSMSLSVKLAIWEASLAQYIDSVEFVVEDLKCGRNLKISRKEVTQKTGELFALRHSINLSSDLLDVPDFYWENDELETLYFQLCGYFSISRRTRVMNEKLNHCMELVELLTSHLSDRHHVRLEWMIIVLIMIEVVIEIIHARH